MTVTITGTDDAAVITGTRTGSVTMGDPDESATVSGAIGVTDVDATDDPTFASACADGAHGSILVNAAGDTWTYTVDRSVVEDLGGGRLIDTVPLADTLGNEATFRITIIGTGGTPVAGTGLTRLSDIADTSDLTDGFKIIGETGGDGAGYSVRLPPPLTSAGSASCRLGRLLATPFAGRRGGLAWYPSRSARTAANVRPSPSRTASRPVPACQRRTATST